MKSKIQNAKSKEMPNAESKNPKGAGLSKPPPYDLCERCAQFGEASIAFAKRIPINPITSPLITQFVKASTSIGANFEEADDAESVKDFHHKVGICRKESRETKFFLRMIVAAEPSLRDPAAELYQEAKELNLIFGSMRRSQPKKKKAP